MNVRSARTAATLAGLALFSACTNMPSESPEPLEVGTHASAAVVALPAYNVDIKQTSVSGLSSGGFMAVQFDVAYSSILKGAGVIAGGPYYCAQGSVNTATGPCMAATSSTNVPQLISTTDSWASAGSIDATSNLANQKIYMFSGTGDTTVKQSVMNDLQTYYQHYISSANISYKNNINAQHAMPTDYYGNSCTYSGDPYINNCAYDGAGQLLQWIYGTLSAKNAGTLGGQFIEFDQSQFIASPNSHSMANTGWLYVPANCANNQTCKLHVVFHGCKQYPSYTYFSGSTQVTYGTTYVQNTGYNKWADTNNIIVLYPQAYNGTGNPNGCWDWWGYDDVNYAKKAGRQMAAVKAMIDRITSGYVALPAPTGLTVTGTTDTSVSLSWSAVSGAAGYNIYRGGTQVNSSLVTGTTYTDSGLTSGTTYSYTVKAATSSGSLSPASNAVNATTTGTAPPVPAPTNLAVSGTTSSSVSLTWTAASGVAGYNIYRSTTATGTQTKVNSSLVTTASFTDSTVAASTTYYYVAKSQSSGGAESAASNQVSATTPMAAVCYTGSNYSHVQAGRAHDSGGYALANGSNQNMGLDNTFYTTTLKQTGTNYYVIGTCP